MQQRSPNFQLFRPDSPPPARIAHGHVDCSFTARKIDFKSHLDLSRLLNIRTETQVRCGYFRLEYFLSASTRIPSSGYVIQKTSELYRKSGIFRLRTFENDTDRVPLYRIQPFIYAEEILPPQQGAEKFRLNYSWIYLAIEKNTVFSQTNISGFGTNWKIAHITFC